MSSSSQNTLSADLLTRLGQEGKPDLYLLGSDGVEVPACRWILASRSDVLDGMLYGNFREATSGRINLDFSSEVLKAVVEFSITDGIQSLDGHEDEATARGLVQLVACAHFLNLPRLEDKAQAFLKDLTKAQKCRPLACAVFEEALLFGTTTESVKSHALKIIRKYPMGCLLGRKFLRGHPLSSAGVSLIGSAALTEIISDKEIDCEEITLFEALESWATKVDGDEAACLSLKEDRANVAKNLATSHIQFSSIPPSDLVGFVKNSGFVGSEVIFEALQAQALLAEKQSEYGYFSKKRKKSHRPSIKVSGAGTKVVNGDYEEDGEYEDHPKYTKKCLWKGEERTFVIYTDGETWYIAVTEKDGSIGEYDNVFYEGCFQAYIPSGWCQTTLGKEPCPTCETC